MTSALLVNAATYLSLALVLYYIIREALNTKGSAQKWIIWTFVILAIAFIAFVFWLNWSKEKDEYKEEEEEFREEKFDNLVEHSQKGEDYRIFSNSSESDSVPRYEYTIQEEYRKKHRKFTLSEGAVVEDSSIKYVDFKQWYLSPDFLEDYTKAIHEAYKFNFKRLLDVRRQFIQDLKTLKSKEKDSDGLSSLLQTLDKSQDVKMIESTITEINNLLREIKNKQQDLDSDTARHNLISALTDKKNGIDSLIGRQNIKDFLALQIYTFAQNPRIFLSHFQNMAIHGPAGAGKTKIAKVIGHVYASSGIIPRNHVHIITKQSLTTAYVNESARITRKLLLANLGGIIFFDEAYDITPPPNLLGQSIDHGHEAITEIVNFLDKMQGLSIMIVAGYEKPMEKRFMSANEGLRRRFPYTLKLEAYTAKELTSILIRFILDTCPNITFDEVHGDYLYTVIHHIITKNPIIFENQAGDMENLSAFIARAIYGSVGKDWEDDAEDIVISGVNAFLAGKGMSLKSN